MNQIAHRKPTQLDRFKQNLELAAPSIAEVLPRHVDLDRFKRIVASAVASNKDLSRAAAENPTSILTSALACAKDGLIPDGREAALVVFNTKIKGQNGEQDRWAATAQYMPMIGGILKMMRQSGEVASLSSHVVYEADEFDYELGDEEKIIHKPALVEDRGKMVAAYAILKTKDGGIYRELMGRDQIMAVKSISKTASKGPWSGPFESEMWKKTVLRRLAKRAPLSTDVIDLIQRDDDMYDLPEIKALPQDKPRVLDLSSGTIQDQDTLPPSDEPQDTLEGDDLPDHATGKTVTEEDKAPEQPAAQQETVEQPKDEAPVDTKPETVKPDGPTSNDPYANKQEVFDAMNAAKTPEEIDAIEDAANSCSWINEKGRKTSVALKASDLRTKLASAE